MKKVLILLPLLTALSSGFANAAYDYCELGQQTSSDSWNIYISTDPDRAPSRPFLFYRNRPPDGKRTKA